MFSHSQKKSNPKKSKEPDNEIFFKKTYQSSINGFSLFFYALNRQKRDMVKLTPLLNSMREYFTPILLGLSVHWYVVVKVKVQNLLILLFSQVKRGLIELNWTNETPIETKVKNLDPTWYIYCKELELRKICFARTYFFWLHYFFE